MLLLDANILIRAVLGTRVPWLLRKYSRQVEFFAPDFAFGEACRHLPAILERRGILVPPALDLLQSLRRLVRVVELESYESFEELARQRLVRRDEDDWPVLACALALGCPIWTEDIDFFGCGVATWTTGKVELYLSEQASFQPQAE